MDSTQHVDGYEGTLESTQFLADESGYVTATPSPSCYSSPEKETVRWASRRSIGQTPLTSQKCNKTNALKKHRHRESSVDCGLAEKCVRVERSTCCSCSFTVGEGIKAGYSPLKGNGALTECFSHLFVGESIIKQDLRNRLEANNEVLLSNSGNKLSSNPKNKSSAYLGKVSTKKFKHDLSSMVTPRRVPYRNNNCGVSHFDILVHLAGVSGCFPGIISQILSYLTPQDLVTMCLVSTQWRQVCIDDPVSNRKRLAYLQHVKHAKENVNLNQFKQNRQSLNLSTSKAVFKEIQNTERRDSSVSGSPNTPRSPPVSPSKVRFNLFFKAGVSLDEGTQLVRCPRCSYPSQVISNNAHCQAIGCRYSFCLSCLCDIHEGLPCRSPTIIPARRKTSIGSKESRRNLRRL